MRIFMLAVVLSVLQAASCNRDKGECPSNVLDKGDDRLTIVNQSAATVVLMLSYDYPGDASVLANYVPSEQDVNTNPATNFGPNSTKKYKASSCWESTFKNVIPSDTLRILLFNVEDIKNHTKQEIISLGMYKNYLYTLADLKALDWKVVYP